MNAGAGRWSDLGPWWLADARRFRLLTWTLPPLLALLAWRLPVPMAAATAGALLFALLWRHPAALVPLLVVLMGNVKFNYYAGFMTVFPEYPVLALACAVVALRAMEGSWRLEERGLVLLSALFAFAAAMSFIEAPLPGRVWSRTVVIGIALLTFHLALAHVRTGRALQRALAVFEVAAWVMAAYGILQIVSLLAGFDVSLRFLERYGNPDFYYGVGSAYIYRLESFFRANSLFNDSNILAGYLAAALSVTFALTLEHAEQGRRRGRVVLEVVALLTLGICLLLTLSRSGMLAAAAGVATVLAFRPEILRRPGPWIAGGTLAVAAVVAALVLKINPILFVVRLGQSLEGGDLSTRLHREVGLFAWRLFARFPITGGGLGNFGLHYAATENAATPGMMAHSAPLTYLSETGLLGAVAGLVLVAAIARRPWRALRDPRLRRADPELHAAVAGLLGALVALFVANLFYDYSLRTFVWVTAALAVAAARLWEWRAARA